jgi:hypothetical protein
MKERHSLKRLLVVVNVKVVHINKVPHYSIPLQGNCLVNHGKLFICQLVHLNTEVPVLSKDFQDLYNLILKLR